MPQQSSADLAKQFGGVPTTADIAKQFGGVAAPDQKPKETAKPTERSWLDEVADAAIGLWKKQPIHPLDMAAGAVEAISSPLQTGKAILEAQGKPYQRAEEKFKRGDYAGGMIEGLNWLLPIIGPQISDLNARTASGETSTAGMVGESVGLGLQAGLPGALKNSRASVPVTPAIRNQNPVQQQAVAFGQSQGIPIDAATATGNRVVRGVQYGADRSLGGALVGQRTEAAQNAALTATGRQLAADASPVASTPYQAGEAIQRSVQASARTHGQQANAAYDALRTIEESPALTERVTLSIPTTAADGTVRMSRVTTDMQMPVNLKVVKAQLRPIYERMRRQMPTTQQQMSKPLKSMENILDAPDHLPASMVDMDLSAIKAMVRNDSGASGVSLGLANTAVATLERELQRAVAKGGQPAQEALAAGRAATVNRYRASDLSESLAAEPVRVFEQATMARDAGIDRLTAMAREAPGTMPQVGRAYIDDLIDRATTEGGFGNAGRIHTRWENLGPRTRALLFPNPAHRQNLDDFFRLARTMSENPNPSGSGFQVGLGAQGVLLVTEPITGAVLTIGGAGLSRLLHSPAGVRALTHGLRIPIGGNRGAAVATFGTIQNLIKDDRREP